MGKWAWGCIAFAGSFVITIVIIFLLLAALNTAFGQEVQPTRPERLSDPDSTVVYKSPYGVMEYESGIAYDYYPYSTYYSCTRHNEVLKSTVRYIATQIAKNPNYGYLYMNTLLLVHSRWDKDCL